MGIVDASYNGLLYTSFTLSRNLWYCYMRVEEVKEEAYKEFEVQKEIKR